MSPPRAWRTMFAALVLAVLALAGCNREGGQLPKMSGEPIKAASEAIKEFKLLRAYPETREGRAVLALEFSQPLAGTQDFNQLLRFKDTLKEEGGWVLADDGENRTLRYQFVEPDTEYTLLISGKLSAADGRVLGNDREEKVFSGDMKPSAGFASQGSVLPAKDSRGLPVVSMNVGEIDVEFFRIVEKRLPAFFAEYRKPGNRSLWNLAGEYSESGIGKFGESVYVNRFLLDAKRNARAVSYLPIQDIEELREPGLYFAVMRRAGSFGDEFPTTFFTISDIGLHARAYRDKMFVHTASLADGGALSGVELRLLDGKGNAVMEAESDRNGNALLPYTLDAAHVLVATKGGNVSLLPFNQPALDLSEFDVGGRPQGLFEVYPWSGRDLYRPGEAVQISALLRDADGKPLKAAGEGAQPLFVRFLQPDGKTFLDTRMTPGALGYYRLLREIPADAPTGEWRLEFRLDPQSKDAVQGMKLHVEEFLPERMKLDLDTARPELAFGEPVPLRVTGRYLYGAPAAGNRFGATAQWRVERHPLAKLPGWFFGDPTVKLPPADEEGIDAKLDDDGKLARDIVLPEGLAPVTPVSVQVLGSLYETGGRSVDRMVKRILWPASALVGVRPLFDPEEGSDANQEAGFEIARYDRAGTPKPQAGLQVKLVRELRDYHWSFDDEGGWSYRHTSRYETVAEKKVDAGGAPAKIGFPVEWGDYRLEVFDPSTRLTTRFPFTAGWSWGDDNRGLDARPDKVKLALDKTRYAAGDKLKVTVTPPQAGKGLLLVESDKLLHVQEIDAKPGSTFTLPVTADWERHDVYITALVFRGGSAKRQVTPARAVGEVHVPMGRDARKVAVGLAVPAMARPEATINVTVAAPQLAGQEAYAVLSVVDVGITNITEYPAPDPWGWFFGKRRFGIDSWDVYGRVIESFEGGMAKLRYGGDAEAAKPARALRPTAKLRMADLHAGPLRLDAKGIARIPLKLPDFNGTLRVSAVVYAADRYGAQSREMVSRAPVVVEPSMPRVLAPGDASRVTVDVGNFSGKPGEFKVGLSASGPVRVDGVARTLRLDNGAKRTLSFPVTATPGYAVAKVTVNVEGGGHRVRREYDLPVRAAWPMVLRTRESTVRAGEAARFDPALAEGLMPGSVDARMVVGVLPPIPFAAALQGALDYPYGCVEQTASKGYAALELDTATSTALGVKPLAASERQRYMEGAFGRLASMQAHSGAFSLWGGGDGRTDGFLTAYVAEFLLDAREGGFAIPESMLRKSLERMNEDLLAGGRGGFYDYPGDERDHLRFAYHAYAGYVLARQNRAPLGVLRTLYDNRRGDSLTGLPLVRLGIALSLQGDKVRGRKAIDEGLAKPYPKGRWFGDYASAIRDQAMMLALLRERGMGRPGDEARHAALARLIEQRREESRWLWLSTQEQNAIARLGKALLAGGKGRLSGAWRFDGGGDRVANTASTARRFGVPALLAASFDPEGEGAFHVSQEVAGVPLVAPAPDNPDLDISRRYFRTDGKPWSGGTLKEGDALIATVEIKSKTYMPNALLTDLLPAGLEVENLNLGDARAWADVAIDGVQLSDRGRAAEIAHEEFRDDRYVAALKLDAGGTARVFYLVRAVSPGSYVVPPPLVEDMYRPTLRGIGKSSLSNLKVVEP
ncbi:alpha-2-macroglobulin family protein [Lysobacter pythonis]|uniref:Alpha-2-macroglobulin n=1 Tax=Solilutibacter pythonis TaxID=2483112 RepID=A0A3M2I4V8_9GAMM|nr:alpha-2-macroglobulin [Lysobacter pythonis]RMH94579.1 alpha-2-macroglobulin family protein [Lysobacter pythonis]